MTNSSTSKLDLIYTYTASLLKDQGESLNRLDTKLSGFLGFAALILRFAINLHSDPLLTTSLSLPCVSCLILKISVCILAGVTIFLCARGLTAQKRGITVDPRELMEDEMFLEKSDEYCKGYIISGWIVITEQYETLGKTKGQTLNQAIVCISLAAIAFAVNLIITAVYIM